MGKSLKRKFMLVNRPSMSHEFTHSILQSLTKNYHLCRGFLKSSPTDDFYSMFCLVCWYICLELIYHKIMNLWRTGIFLVQPCGSYNTLHNSRHIANPQALWVSKWTWVSEECYDYNKVSNFMRCCVAKALIVQAQLSEQILNAFISHLKIWKIVRKSDSKKLLLAKLFSGIL